MILVFSPGDKSLHWYDDNNIDKGPFCEGFWAEKVMSDISSGDETVEIKIHTKLGIKKALIPAKDFTPKQLPCYLLSKGVTFLADNENSLMITAYALESKAEAPVSLYHSRLGWDVYHKKKVYLHSGIIFKDLVLDNCIYEDSKKITPKGTFKAWREGILPFLSRPEVALALIVGASATLIPLLKKEGLFTETLIFALISQSSTFKTTMLKMMSSVYGKPSIGDGIIDTTNDTTGYFFGTLGKKNGFLHCIDDISAAQGHDFSNELYTISTGKSRGRLSPDGTPKKIETWCTTVVYTGETSMFEQTNHNKGLYARLIEFSFEWLTEDYNINEFYNVINSNYGVAIKPLVKTLFALSSEDFRKLYQDSLSIITEIIPDRTGVSYRIAQRFAILVMTLCICNEAWELELKIPDILPLLKQAYQNNIAVIDPVSLAIEGLKAQILYNNSKFLKEEDYVGFPRNLWGVYGKYCYNNCLWIVKDKMLELASAAGIQDFKSIQNALAERGFLIKDKTNHYLFKKKVGLDFEVKCYGIYPNGKTEPAKPKEKKKSCLAQNSQLQKLLSPEEEEENED